MVFQPMLPEVVSSAISPQHVVNPLRLLCKSALVLRGQVEEIHWPERNLTLNVGPFCGRVTVEFEHLVLALGADVDLSHTPGMAEHAFLMRNAGDALRLRMTIIGRIEEASLEQRPEVRRRLLSFVVVGGGYSGVETAGHVLGLFHSIHGYYRSISQEDLRVYLVHSRDHLLPTLNRRLGEYSARKLEQRGLKLILNQRVKSVTADRVYLQDGSEIETNTVICTVGNSPHPLIKNLCQACGLECVKGQLLTEPTCQVKGEPQLWAGGDCAAVPFIKGGFCPDTAQFAMRQGTLIGMNLARAMRQQELRRFTFTGFGEMASIGHYTAVAEIFGMQFSGFLAWWLWRTVYLAKLPRLDRKIRVVLDWTLDLFFPRDINYLSPRYSELLQEVHLEPGDVLFQPGEPAFSLYIVKSGAVEVRQAGELVQRITEGESLGEQALLGDGIWHFHAAAAQRSDLISIPAKMFRQIVRGAGSLRRFFERSAAKFQSRAMLEMIAKRMPEPLARKPISELMQRRLLTFRPDMTMRDALEIARGHPRSSYPVIDASGHVMGVVNRDDFYNFIKRPETTPDSPLSQMQFSNLPSVRESLSVGEAMKFLSRDGSHKLLVADSDQRLIGIITLVDFVAAQAAASGEAPAQERDRQPAGTNR